MAKYLGLVMLAILLGNGFASQIESEVIASVGNFDYPVAIGVHPSGSPLYIANSGDSTISIVETGTFGETQRVWLSQDRPLAVAISPTTLMAYIPTDSGNVYLLDLVSDELIAFVRWANLEPRDIAIDPEGKHLYVLPHFLAGQENGVVVIDLTTLRMIDSIDVDASDGSILLSPDGYELYVVSPYENVLSVLATARRGRTPIRVPLGSTDLALSTDGRYLYAVSVYHNALSVFDTASYDVVATKSLAGELPESDQRIPSNPTKITVSPLGNRAYVTSFTTGMLTVVDTMTNEVVATREIANGLSDVAVSPDGGRVYVINALTNTLTVLPAF
ncbi:MAG: YncE family protein [Parcubacteria group bacterium]|nr:YncE family protein [Parcubacteria group bacterium]